LAEYHVRLNNARHHDIVRAEDRRGRLRVGDAHDRSEVRARRSIAQAEIAVRNRKQPTGLEAAYKRIDRAAEHLEREERLGAPDPWTAHRAVAQPGHAEDGVV